MSSELLAPAAPAPELHLPPGDKTVTVKVINTTCFIQTTNISRFMHPQMKGHDKLTAPAYSFLIEHESHGETRRLVFDLGVRKDWENMAPVMVKMVTDGTWDLYTEKNVADILTETGIDTKSIEAVIWSHWHFDHIGDPSTFPKSTDLIVGPGFKEALLPGYPANENAPFLESDYSGRSLREIDFEKEGGGLTLGRFAAFDYFGDGSFYLLDAPGHAVGHICGLARTSLSPPTFILMGADSCHHGGEFRPSQYLPLPKHIVPNPINPRRTGAWPRATHSGSVCPGSLFLDIHFKKSPTQPFYELSPNGVHHDKETTEKTIEKIQEFDVNPNVFVCMAHDEHLLDVIDFYPKSANDWKQRGWAEDSKWMFLGDLSAGLGNVAGKL
ncbi:metallo-beta-lactamase superfamily protein [Rhizodiscina lignyota]|uniref:Metallo-beta-lactamase superfamily protein n=1 Tax=Rhizodiscina lignyota TaxID=1504668 RepID=A0A9P4IF10_9PEZI|nr:metallo-beta-lactamase superfamily protein [Rhizodiscina lignyota]